MDESYINESTVMTQATAAALIMPMSIFADLSKQTRSEIMEAMMDGSSASSLTSHSNSQTSDSEGPAELTKALVRKLTSTMGGKTTNALRAIAEGDRRFRSSTVLAATGDADLLKDLRAVWAAITRRTRNVLNDPDADLIWWDEDGIFDKDGEYIDHEGEVSEITHNSLRAHFGLSSQ